MKNKNEDVPGDNDEKNEKISSKMVNEPEIMDHIESEADNMEQSDMEDVSHHVLDTANESDSLEEDDSDANWQNRVLCSDGNCIGVIGPDGLCKECGKPYEGDEEFFVNGNTKEMSDSIDPEEESVVEADEEFSNDQDESSEIYDDTDGENDTDEQPDPDDEWENRILCSDGNCIGVIGPDGRCKECGKPYEK